MYLRANSTQARAGCEDVMDRGMDREEGCMRVLKVTIGKKSKQNI